MRTFLIIWAGRVVGVLGAKAGAFALSLWVYQHTGSITQFSVGLFLGFVPGLLLSPAAGVLIDRHNRRTVLACADAAALVAGAALLTAQATGHLAVWQIYAVVAVQSACATFQWPALAAAVTDVVPPAQRGRAAAMTQTALSVAQLLGPTLATVLLGFGGLTAVLVADTGSVVFGLLTLAVTRIPPTARLATAPERPGWRGELRVGLQLIRTDPRLTHLLRLTAALFAGQAAAPVVLLPLIVAGVPHERQGLAVAVVSTAAGIGLATASLAMAVLPQPRTPMVWIRTAMLISAVAVVVAGLAPTTEVLIVAAFVFSAGVPVVVSSAQGIWQEATDPGAQGRVFALRRMVVQAATMAGLLLAGPLTAYVGTPLRSVFPTSSGLLLCGMGVALAAVALPRPVTAGRTERVPA